ncbi:hypothetical protein NMY22_g10356 [Coprinellus aureogranulatus]|nr:hypothetical protein NMY22_g10356 [Coprinellus aureogranulatus]
MGRSAKLHKRVVGLPLLPICLPGSSSSSQKKTKSNSNPSSNSAASSSSQPQAAAAQAKKKANLKSKAKGGKSEGLVLGGADYKTEEEEEALGEFFQNVKEGKWRQGRDMANGHPKEPRSSGAGSTLQAYSFDTHAGYKILQLADTPCGRNPSQIRCSPFTQAMDRRKRQGQKIYDAPEIPGLVSFGRSPPPLSSPKVHIGFHVDNITVNNSLPRNDKAFQILLDNIAIDAVHNSEERYDAPKCHPETRKAVQQEILSWITHGDEDSEPKKILWLTGPAGTGKTAIMGSIADTCDEEGLLAGSFFYASFTGSEKRCSKRYLVATLTYHLIQALGDDLPLRHAILAAIQRDPLVFKRQLRDQFRIVLLKPFNESLHQFDPSVLPKVFILDGLDEVETSNSRQLDQYEARLVNEKDQEDILSALLFAANDKFFPFRIIIASRSERVIRAFFSSEAVHITREIFLDEKYNPSQDIALYLKANFTDIRRRYKLPSSWPVEWDIGTLVGDASGQFIYAATVIRFLKAGKHPNPKAILATILDWRSKYTMVDALTPLDALYTRILMSSPDPHLAVRWIGTFCENRQWGFSNTPALFVDQILQDFEGHADYLLENLTSLVWVPRVEDRYQLPYHTHHKSLSDFLQAGGRQNPFYEDYVYGRDVFVAERFLRVWLDKSPVVQLAEPDLQIFIHNFFLIHFSASLHYDMDKCDVIWWLHYAFAAFPEDEKPFQFRRCINTWFALIHARSGCINLSLRCEALCVHWRSNILRLCRKLGWKGIIEIDLLREHMFYRENRRWGSYLSPYLSFQPWPVDEPVDEAWDLTVQATTTLYTVDEDYQMAYKFARAMHLYLSSSEKAELLKMGDASLPSALEKVRCDLRLRSRKRQFQCHWRW